MDWIGGPGRRTDRNRLTDTLGVLKKRNTKMEKNYPRSFLWLFGFLKRQRCLRPEGKGELQRAS